MIAGIFHQGSGLGNQLHRYVMTRVVALDKGYDWGMINPQNFKGESFMNIDKGEYVTQETYKREYHELRVNNKQGVDVRNYDWNLTRVPDNCIIDGEFQGERYFRHRLNHVREWLKVEPLIVSRYMCVINFRGGEYTAFPELFLTKDYWEDAIKYMEETHKIKHFVVHTDDPVTARIFFPNYEIVHDIGLNWRSIRYAHYLILSNSSFAILPALLNENVKEIIAPKYWARRNSGFWALKYNRYKGWKYI